MKKINEQFLQIIKEEIKNNPKVLERELALKYSYSERSVRRYFKILKEGKEIIYASSGKNRNWQIIDK